jgi:hypothetical protein
MTTDPPMLRAWTPESSFAEAQLPKRTRNVMDQTATVNSGRLEGRQSQFASCRGELSPVIGPNPQMETRSPGERLLP